MASVNKLMHFILKARFKGKYTYRELGKILFKTFLIKIKKMESVQLDIRLYELCFHLFPTFWLFEL